MARLAALVLCGLLFTGGAAPSQDVRTITIDIEHSRFLPASVVVEEGEEVRFVIRNGDPIDHEFILGDDHVQAIHEEGTEAHHGAKAGEVSVAAFDEATTTFVFEDARELIFGCHLPAHYDYGMRGVVLVR